MRRRRALLTPGLAKMLTKLGGLVCGLRALDIRLLQILKTGCHSGCYSDSCSHSRGSPERVGCFEKVRA